MMQLKNNKVNLCDSCIHTYHDCPAFSDDVVFGDGVWNVCACSKYEHIRIDADAISRQAAIDALCKMRCGCVLSSCPLTFEEDGTEECADVRMLMELPSAQPDVPDRNVGEWDMFELITSTWYGKQCYFVEENGTVYSRVSCKYMSVDEAIKEFLWRIGDNG